MARCGYSVSTESAVALAAATAKTILGVKSGSVYGLDWKKYRVSFDGVVQSNVPVLIELCYCTWATNSPGTNSTGVTEDQVYGRVITPDFTGARNWTAEPTVLTPFDEYLLTPAGGVVLYDFPLGDTPDCAVSEGFAIRCTAPAIVNVRATMWVEKC